MSLLKVSKGVISTIQRHSTDGITISIRKQTDARATLSLPLQRSILEVLTTGGSGDGDRKRRGFIQYVFVLTFVLSLESTELQQSGAGDDR